MEGPASARWDEVEVRRAHRGWRVLVPCESGNVLEYRYPKRRQATYFASIFRLGPTWLPPPDRVRPAQPVSPFGADAAGESLEEAVQRALDAAFGGTGADSIEASFADVL